MNKKKINKTSPELASNISSIKKDTTNFLLLWYHLSLKFCIKSSVNDDRCL